ncbi:hypothetical protein LTR65_010357 [Meristemomyces frigidus]
MSAIGRPEQQQSTPPSNPDSRIAATTATGDEEPTSTHRERGSPPPYSAIRQPAPKVEGMQALQEELAQIHRSHELTTQALEALEARLVTQEGRSMHVAEHYEATMQTCKDRIDALTRRVGSDVDVAHARTVDARIDLIEIDVRLLRSRLRSRRPPELARSPSRPSPAATLVAFSGVRLGPQVRWREHVANHRHMGRPQAGCRFCAEERHGM